MNFLFLFLDGVGLGENDPQNNPLAAARMPNLMALLAGHRLVRSTVPLETDQATLLELDATLGVKGLPQSATGQATLLTGVNVPQAIGRHYGPKPNPEVAAILKNGTLFSNLLRQGKQVALLNAYPERYFESIDSGHRLYSAIPLAVTSAGIALKTTQEFFAGEALSADFTGQGWREHLGYVQAPVMDPFQAGVRLGELVGRYDLAFFEFWLSDFIGHRQDWVAALETLELLDAVIGGLLTSRLIDSGLILLTSDHGNLEDLHSRRHTDNPVPALVIGEKGVRRTFAENLQDLTSVTPAILQLFSEER